MNDKEFLEKCMEIRCPYGVNYNINIGSNYITLKNFLDGEKIKELKEKFPQCKLRFYLRTDRGSLCFYKFTTDKFYNINNELLNKSDIENYQIDSNIRIMYDMHVEGLKLKEYIDMMKEFKEVYVFRHQVIIDCNNEPVNILFGEGGVLVYRNFEVIKDKNKDEYDHYLYKYPILSVNLLPY